MVMNVYIYQFLTLWTEAVFMGLPVVTLIEGTLILCCLKQIGSIIHIQVLRFKALFSVIQKRPF